jgi:hypothetical protein
MLQSSTQNAPGHRIEFTRAQAEHLNTMPDPHSLADVLDPPDRRAQDPVAIQDIRHGSGP